MLRWPTLVAIVLAAASCHADLRNQRCDPYRTPRTGGPPVAKAEERSAHAPWSAGDCWACHLPAARVAGESLDEARLYRRLIRPVNEHCTSCHLELFRAPPRGHPPEQAFCTSCHDPHNSRQPSLLRDEDRTRTCLDYPPPVPEKRLRSAASRRAGP